MMGYLGLVLLCLAGLGMAAFALRFARHPAFIDYHQTIIDKNGGTTAGTETVIVALYRVVAGAMSALTFLHFTLVLGPIWQDDALWAKAAVLVAVLLVGLPAALVPREVETRTGVRTPWRASAGLIVVAFIGLVLTLV